MTLDSDTIMNCELYIVDYFEISFMVDVVPSA